jgi:two-component system cell cycle sensor histidine kinase PleC
MIADVLEMSRLEAGRVRLETERFVVEDAVQTAMDAVADIAAEKSIKIEMERARGAQLLADKTAIEKVLTILLNNAVKYTPAQGSVKIRARAMNGALSIFVEDTGVGIPPEAIDRLGKPFEQFDKGLKNGMRGSGLGLAIAHSLVDLHGGSLRIESQPGVGTIVVVHLPNRQNVPRPDLQLATSSLRAQPRLAPHDGGRTQAKRSRIA